MHGGGSRHDSRIRRRVRHTDGRPPTGRRCTRRRCAEWKAAPKSPRRGLFHQGLRDDDRPPQGFPYGQPSAGPDRASFSRGLDTGPSIMQLAGMCYRARTRPRLDERTRTAVNDRDVLLCQGLLFLSDFSSNCDLWLEELLGDEGRYERREDYHRYQFGVLSLIDEVVA